MWASQGGTFCKCLILTSHLSFAYSYFCLWLFEVSFVNNVQAFRKKNATGPKSILQQPRNVHKGQMTQYKFSERKRHFFLQPP